MSIPRNPHTLRWSDELWEAIVAQSTPGHISEETEAVLRAAYGLAPIPPAHDPCPKCGSTSASCWTETGRRRAPHPDRVRKDPG